jgi:hypothetical protein
MERFPRGNTPNGFVSLAKLIVRSGGREARDAYRRQSVWGNPMTDIIPCDSFAAQTAGIEP